MSEIRSYRRVFDLERRVYSVDRLRLNPGGVPVRGIAYFLVLVLLAVASAAIPVVRGLASTLPWLARDLAIPATAATVLSLVRIEGRVFHLSAAALVRQIVAPRRTCGVSGRSVAGSTWYPESLVLLPDGSDRRLRRLRFTGPGAVRVSVAHECAPLRGGVRHMLIRRCALEVRAPTGEASVEGSVIEISAGTRLLIAPGASGGRPG